ncbi:MAG: hypothetical protein LBV74_02450 [Tannerella sp.]|jgi:hypothetical protein|nr:hypothetical protein [Tannerella sp.]
MKIDGKNILSTWGFVLQEGSYNSLFKYPDRKAVSYADYAERDGIISDLRKFETESRKITLNFLSKNNSTAEFRDQYQNFFMAMIAPGYRIVDMENGLIYKLRYDQTQTIRPFHLFNSGPDAALFSVCFLEDEPAIDENVITPTGLLPLTGWYEVDGVDFANFGVHPNGEIGEVLKYPELKTPFTDSRTYSLETMRLKHKEIVIPLWMRAETEAEFVRNYQAFYNAFAKAGKRLLYIKEIDTTTYAYYMGCTSFTTHWNDKPGAFFNIKLCIPVVTWLSGMTSVYAVLKDSVLGLLADEQGKILILNK